MEAVIEPERPIIDAHHHLWTAQAGWAAYLLDDIRQDVEGGHNIKATVWVEGHADYDTDHPNEVDLAREIRFANAIAEDAIVQRLGTRYCAGLVSNIDFRFDNVADILDTQIQTAPNRMRGVRQLAAWFPEHVHLFDEKPEYYNTSAFRRGFAQLAPRQLSFDACAFHFHIPQVVALADAFPDTTIILNHLGLPLGIGPYAGKVEEVMVAWKPLVREAARCSNMIMKLGGQCMATAGHLWSANGENSQRIVAVTGDYFRHAIDQFGPDRCMFESNFPMDASVTTYRSLWNAFKLIATPYSAEERHALFYETANRVYRLGSP